MAFNVPDEWLLKLYNLAKLHYLGDGALIRLFSNPPDPPDNPQLSDFTETTFDGYAPKPAAFSAPFIEGLNAVLLNGGPYLWTRGSGPVSDVVYGYYVTDIDGDLAFCQWSTFGEFNLLFPGNTVRVEIRYPWEASFSLAPRP